MKILYIYRKYNIQEWAGCSISIFVHIAEDKELTLNTDAANVAPYEALWHPMTHSGTLRPIMAPYDPSWHPTNHCDPYDILKTIVTPYNPSWHPTTHCGTP